MGCGSSTAASQEPVKPEIQEHKVPASVPEVNKAAGAPTPQLGQIASGSSAAETEPGAVRPFAVMRLTHEAIRAGMNMISAQVEYDKVDAALEAYDQLRLVINVHATHEDKGMFPLLDSLFDNVCLNNGLRDEHENDHKRDFVVRKALQDAGKAGGDKNDAFAALNEWIAEHEKHLKHEEDIMMPLTEKVAETVELRGASMQKVLACDSEGFERIQLPYVINKLDHSKPFGAVKMFVEGLQMSSTVSAYERYVTIMKAEIKSETAAQLEKAGCFGPGKQLMDPPARTGSFSDHSTVRPFAVMRLTHEAIRAGIIQINAFAEYGKFEEALKQYDTLREAIQVHATHAELGLFPLLDRLFDNVCTKANLKDEHDADFKFEEEIRNTLLEATKPAGDATAAIQKVADWSTEHEKHLQHEEEVVMPLIEKVAETVEAQGAEMQKIIASHLVGFEDILLPFVANKLDHSKPFGPVKMFVEALQMSSTPATFARFVAIIRANVKASTAEQLDEQGCFGIGKQTTEAVPPSEAPIPAKPAEQP
mmetsp:Transcript_31766/g.49706  ORF Transcript_31766/g.49706 Transcript_31766/m.49706 type:complete len:536 (-) Transcript_31766:350-1957(-)